MVSHLFLTGEKGVGKSTLLRKLLARSGRKPGGFFTVKTEDVFPGRVSLHLLAAGTAEVPGPENFLFFCGGPPDGGEAERFDRLGCAALTEDRAADILIMDELGPREEEARRFQGAVFRALDGDVPVLGVLQRAESDFLQRTAAHPRGRVVEVTAANRDELAEALLL